jgi:hypothetical protein
MSEEKRGPDENSNPDPNPNPNPDPERTEPMSRDWSRWQDDEARSREAERAAREAERLRREQEQMARERERMTREQERMGREQQRQAREREREQQREQRRTEREARREEWRAQRIRMRGHGMHIDGVEVGPLGGFGDFAKGFMKDFVSDATGESYTETQRAEFVFERMPRLRVRNISGETRIRVGEPGKITIVATKHVSASSEDRAKRLLQNLEIRMEKNGDELRVEPHLYEQERGWVDLFRGKRFRVDFDITVPQEVNIDAETVSGDVSVNGVRGPLDVQAVSGELTIEDAQGPLRLKSVSGDVDVKRYVGHVEGNTVSGDISFDASRIRSLILHTVSGDIEIKGVLEAARAHRFKTISGDVELSLADPDLVVEYRTASGDLECDIPARVDRQGKKQYSVGLGDARGHSIVKTVSGDLTIRGTVIEVPGEPTTEEPSGVRPEFAAGYRSDEDEAQAEAAAEAERADKESEKSREEIKSVLEKLAKGELGVDDAAAALDAARKAR